ncbi:MAG: hypothetical protein LBP52_08950 [Burkholderiaceae bacterium]|jgi:hypothetical protein|nr:hypothetical protein [Burkholderiaceae bacterium]
MTIRLEAVAPALFEKLKVASAVQQKEAAMAACKLVFRKVPMPTTFTFVQDFMRHLSGNEKPPPRQTAELNRLAEKLDEDYLRLRESPDEEENKKALLLFSQARAMCALVFAENDSFASLAESVYEASMALDDGGTVFDVVSRVLDG